MEDANDMNDLERARSDLVIANRILAHEGVVDAYGHVSMRRPDNPERFILSRSRSPELVEADIQNQDAGDRGKRDRRPGERSSVGSRR